MSGTHFALPTDPLALVGPWVALLSLCALVIALAWWRSSANSVKAFAGLAMGGVLLCAGLLGWHQQQLGVELGPDGLILHGMVRTEVERSQVYAKRAKIIDLDKQPSFEIQRALDTGLGWRQGSGWAVLRNGMVVYALVGEGREWVMLPTAEHYYVALAVEDTGAFTQALQAWGDDVAQTKDSV